MKTAKIFFLSAILILTHNTIFGQWGWSYLKQSVDGYPFGYADVGINSSDSNYVVCGHFAQWDGDMYLYGKVFIVKLDTLGNVIWENSYTYHPDWYDVGMVPTSISQVSDGGYIVSAFNTYNDEFWICKVNSDGVEEWQNNYEDSHSHSYSVVYELPDGNFELFYSNGKIDNNDSPGFQTMKLSPTGEIIEEDGGEIRQYFGMYPYWYADDLYDLVAINSNEFVLAGRINFNPDSTILAICKFDSDQDLLWAASYGVPDSVYIKKLLPLHDDNFLFFGNSAVYPEPDSTKIYAIKVDSIGNVLWSYSSYSDTRHVFPVSVTERSDGSIVILSKASDSIELLPNYYAEFYELTFLNADGSIISKQQFRYTPFSYGVWGPLEQYYQIITDKNDNLLLLGMTGNEFLGLWGEAQMTVIKLSPEDSFPCIFDCAWPGDANNDSTANMDDLLTIGIAFSAAGAERTSADNFWYAHTADVWADTLADGTNYKYADCNGDGIINDDDTLAISLNYGLEHPVYSLRTTDDLPEIYLAPVSDTLPLGLVHIPVMLGSDTDPVELYGIKFSITYSDDEIIDSTTMEMNFDDCWLGTADELLTMQKTLPEIKTLDVGITRNDHTNVTGGGQVGELSFVVVDNIAGKTNGGSSELTLHINNVKANKNNEEEVFINGSDYSFKLYSGIHEIPAENTFTIYPNPANDFVYFDSRGDQTSTISVYDINGAFIKSFSAEEIAARKLNIADLSPGQYMIRLVSGSRSTTGKLMILR